MKKPLIDTWNHVRKRNASGDLMSATHCIWKWTEMLSFSCMIELGRTLEHLEDSEWIRISRPTLVVNFFYTVVSIRACFRIWLFLLHFKLVHINGINFCHSSFTHPRKLIKGMHIYLRHDVLSVLCQFFHCIYEYCWGLLMDGVIVNSHNMNVVHRLWHNKLYASIIFK